MRYVLDVPAVFTVWPPEPERTRPAYQGRGAPRKPRLVGGQRRIMAERSAESHVQYYSLTGGEFTFCSREVILVQILMILIAYGNVHVLVAIPTVGGSDCHPPQRQRLPAVAAFGSGAEQIVSVHEQPPSRRVLQSGFDDQSIS